MSKKYNKGKYKYLKTVLSKVFSLLHPLISVDIHVLTLCDTFPPGLCGSHGGLPAVFRAKEESAYRHVV